MNDRRPRILSISFSGIRSDARVLRQLDVLSEFGHLTSVGFDEKPDQVDEHLQVPSGLASLPQTVSGVALLGLHRFRAAQLAAPALSTALRLVSDRRFDLVVANDARALPLAHAVAHGAPVWADLHEWAPEERSHVLSWRLLVAPLMTWICREYLPRCAAITTVNESITELYRAEFGVQASVVRNARAQCALTPSPVAPNIIRLVHSGAAVPDRGIETLIEATIALGERFSLDLYLLESPATAGYMRSLRHRAGDSPRIRFNEAVPPDSLPEVLNQFDLGVFSLSPATENHRLMLPNKFFDFVQARLGVVFSHAPETDRLITEFAIGTIVDGFSAADMVAALQRLSADDVVQFKAHADAAAGPLSSETDRATQRAIAKRLLNLPG